MTLKAIEVDHYRIPLPVTLSDATHGDISHFELVTVRITAADGAEGVGYTYTVGAGGEAIRSLIVRELKPILLDQDSTEIEAVWQRMWWALHWVGRGGLVALAVSAVDIALWDLEARRQSAPLWRLLGGSEPRVPAYAGGVDLHFPEEQLLQQARDNLAAGYRALKMKVGRPRLDEDVARVAAMRGLIGRDVALMVDVNMGWTVEEAIGASHAFAEYDITWLEEPTIPDDFAGHVRVVEEGALPVAAGENLRTIHEFRHLVETGGVSYPEPDVSNCGGITVWLQVAELARMHDLPVTSHGVHDLHVHLLAAAANSSYLEIHGFGLERFIADPLEIRDGVATAPDRPGHGVAFDWAALAEFRA